MRSFYLKEQFAKQFRSLGVFHEGQGISAQKNILKTTFSLQPAVSICVFCLGQVPQNRLDFVKTKPHTVH